MALGNDLVLRLIIAAQDMTGNAVDSAKSGLNSISESIKSVYDAAKAYLTFQVAVEGGDKLIEMADLWAKLEARIKLASGETWSYTDAEQGLLNISNEVGTKLEDTVQLYQRIAKSIRDMGGEQRDSLQLTETISKSFVVSGASASEASSGVTQLGQALGSGVLRGDEFNSMMENAPTLAVALANGLQVPISALRKMAEAGELTAAKVTGALLSQSDAIEAQFSKMPLTVERAITGAENNLLEYVGKINQSVGATQAIAEAIKYAGNHIQEFSSLGVAAAAVYAGQLTQSVIGYTKTIYDSIQAKVAERAAIAETTQATIQSSQATVNDARETRALLAGKVALTEALIRNAEAQLAATDAEAQYTAYQVNLAKSAEAVALATVEATQAEIANTEALLAGLPQQDAMATTQARRAELSGLLAQQNATLASAEAELAAAAEARIAGEQALSARITERSTLEARLIAENEALAASERAVASAEEAHLAANEALNASSAGLASQLKSVSGVVNVLMSAFVGWEIGRFLSQFELARVAGARLSEVIHIAMTSVVDFHKVVNGEMSFGQLKEELSKIHQEYNQIAQDATESGKHQVDAATKVAEAQSKLASSLTTSKDAATGLQIGATITDEVLKKLESTMNATKVAADKAAEGYSKGTVTVDQLSVALDEANKAIADWQSGLKQAEAQLKSYIANQESHISILQAQTAAGLSTVDMHQKLAVSMGDERQALQALSDKTRIETVASQEMFVAKKELLAVAQQHLDILIKESNADNEFTDKEKQVVEAAKADVEQKRQQVVEANNLYSQLVKLPASLTDIASAQKLSTDEMKNYHLAAIQALTDAQNADTQYKAGKITLDELTQAQASAKAAIDAYTQATRIATSETDSTNAALQRHNELVNQTNTTHIKQLQALQALAKAQGDLSGVVQIGNAIALEEVKASQDAADGKLKEAKAAQDKVAAVIAEAEADGRLTVEEQANIQAAKDAAEAKRLEAEATQADADKKLYDATATQKNTEATQQNTGATKNQASADKQATDSGGQYTSMLGTMTNAIAKYSANQAKMFENMILNLPTFESMWSALNEGQKILDGLQKEMTHVTAQTKELSDAASSGIGLDKALMSAGIDASNLDKNLNTVSSSVSNLDQTQLQGLQDAIQAAIDKVKSLRAEADSTVESLQQELYQMEGNAKASENLSYQVKMAELQSKLDAAQKAGDKKTEDSYRKALSLEEEIHAKKLQAIDDAKKAADEQAKAAAAKKAADEKAAADKAVADKAEKAAADAKAAQQAQQEAQQARQTAQSAQQAAQQAEQASRAQGSPATSTTATTGASTATAAISQTGVQDIVSAIEKLGATLASKTPVTINVTGAGGEAASVTGEFTPDQVSSLINVLNIAGLRSS